MGERRRELSEAGIERALLALRHHLEYPPTPPLARSVRRALEGPRPRSRPWATGLPGRRGLAVTLAALLLVVTLALAPPVRVVAERLGLRGIFLVELAPSSGMPLISDPAATSAPPATPSPTPGDRRMGERSGEAMASPTPSDPGRALRLGEPVTMDEARRRAPYRILVPTLPELGEPDLVYVSGPGNAPRVALIYEARPGLPAVEETGVGLLVVQFRGDLEPGTFGKGLGPGARLEAVVVDGDRGFWIEGQAHLFFYRDEHGQFREETFRLAANTLLWERGDLTLRLEGALSKDEALRIATSMR